MKVNHQKFVIFLCGILFSLFFLACHPEKDILTIADLQINPDYFEDHPSAFPYKLYFFNSQEELDNFSETHSLDCSPEIDFSSQTLLLVWGKVGGKCVNIQPELVNNGEGSYVLNLKLTTDLYSWDNDWSYACVTNRKLRDEEIVTLNVQVKSQEAFSSWIPISVFGVDYGFCRNHCQPDTLYRINSQQEMDSFFQQYPFPLPEIDFSTQTMFLTYGNAPGSVMQRAVRIRENMEGSYNLNINLLEILGLIEGDPWVTAFWTYKKIQDTDSVRLTVNMLEI